MGAAVLDRRTTSRVEAAADLPAICRAGVHFLPLLRTEEYDANPLWKGFGDCAGCGSTLHRDSLRPASDAVTSKAA